MLWIRIRIDFGQLDPDPGGKKWPKKIEKSEEISRFEVLDVLFWGLKASPVAWMSLMEVYSRDKIWLFFNLIKQDLFTSHKIYSFWS
jgi:hypothetical protein